MFTPGGRRDGTFDLPVRLVQKVAEGKTYTNISIIIVELIIKLK